LQATLAMHYPTPKVKRLAETLVLEWPGKSCVQPQWGSYYILWNNELGLSQ
jgi:hypothetical protein